MDVRNKTVLITGGKRIGHAVAMALAGRGANIALTYQQSRDEAEATAGEVRATGVRASVRQADVSVEAECLSLVAGVEREYGRLDVLVNMASMYKSVPFDEVTFESWRRQISVDLDGTFYCSYAAVPAMRRAGGGRIVNFTDWVAASARPRYQGYLAYYVAKAGVKALTEALALEVAADQILVNAIAPGPVLAPPGTSDEEIKTVERATPLGRWGGAEQIAKAVGALIDSDFITGETIRVDGGRHLK
jgi:NAD(P)-dependent dehydrogenase (short-subunit alcohol dehydrogenase family)